MTDKTTEALNASFSLLNLIRRDKAWHTDILDAVLAAIREALAKQDHFAAFGKPIAKQEPVIKYPGCYYCNDELFCGRKCKCCGKVFIEDEDFEQSEVKSLRKQVAALKAILDAWNNVEQEPVAWVGEFVEPKEGLPKGAPLYAAPVRTVDLTDDEIMKINVDTASIVPTCDRQFHFARAVIAADREKNRG